MLTNPVIHPAFPSDAYPQFLKVWDARERFLSALDKLPQVFAHQDPVRRNVFLRRGRDGEYETVAIDWAYVGNAALAMDIAVPFIINLGFMELDVAHVHEFDVILSKGYLNGLHDAGWNGDVRQVRLGFTASAVCKYIETVMLLASLGLLTDSEQYPGMEKTFGHPMPKLIEQAGGIFRYVMQLADEADQIMDTLGYS
jgi:hypothetical protein